MFGIWIPTEFLKLFSDIEIEEPIITPGGEKVEPKVEQIEKQQSVEQIEKQQSVIKIEKDKNVEQIDNEEENFDTQSIDSLETHSDPNLDQNIETEPDADLFRGFTDVDESSRVKLSVVEIDKNGNTFGMTDFLDDGDSSDGEDMSGVIEIMFSQELQEHYIKLLKDDKASLAALRKVTIHRPASSIHSDTSLQCQQQIFPGLKEVEDEFVADSLHHYEMSTTVKTPKRSRKTPAKSPATKKIATPRGRKSVGGKHSLPGTNLMTESMKEPQVFPLPPSPISSPSEGNSNSFWKSGHLCLKYRTILQFFL